MQKCIIKTVDTSMGILEKGALHFGVTITKTQLEIFQSYFEALVDWNRRINLTAITDYDEVQKNIFLIL